MNEKANEAYIDWLHEPHEWVPGSVPVVQDAFIAGWNAALYSLKELSESLDPAYDSIPRSALELAIIRMESSV